MVQLVGMCVLHGRVDTEECFLTVNEVKSRSVIRMLAASVLFLKDSFCTSPVPSVLEPLSHPCPFLC
jgi:hypothetical protein